MELLLSQIQKTVQVFESADVVPSVSLAITRGRTRSLDVEGKLGGRLSDEPVYIVVEGFLLFAHAGIVAMMSHCLFLSIDGDTGAMRRYLRTGGSIPCDDSNSNFVKFKRNYKGHIFKHYEEFRDMLIRNAGDKLRARIDGTLQQDEVARIAVSALKRAMDQSGVVGTDSAEVSTNPPAVPALMRPLANEQIFTCLESTRAQRGRWRSSRSGMHGIERPHGRATPEPPSTVEYNDSVEAVHDVAGRPKSNPMHRWKS